MKALLIIIVIIGLPIWGVAQQTIYGSISHDSMQRDYILYVPANYSGTESVPLILNYHGFGSTAGEQMFYGDFRAISDTAGFLIVHPQGTLFYGVTHWNVGGWTIGSTTDDVGFTNALIDSLAMEYNIDSTRIYATGMSNGGFMSFLLSCQLGDKIAAIASITGSMTPETYDDCSPYHPTPILQMHGTSDDVVPYDGAIWSKSIDEVLQYWVEYNNCNSLASVTPLPDIDPNDGSTVEHIVFSDGDNDVNVEHYKITGGGHTWPGSAFGAPGTNYDIDASVEIWKFFMKYDIYGGAGGTTAIEHPDENNLSLIIYPNPATSHIHIKSDLSGPIDFEIISILGELMISGVISQNDHQIDISDFPQNIYFLRIGNSTYKILKTE